MSNQMTLNEIERIYGDLFFSLYRGNCKNHKSIGECNSVKYYNANGKKCETLYEVRGKSEVIRENFNKLKFYRNKESVG